MQTRVACKGRDLRFRLEFGRVLHVGSGVIAFRPSEVHRLTGATSFVAESLLVAAHYITETAFDASSLKARRACFLSALCAIGVSARGVGCPPVSCVTRIASATKGTPPMYATNPSPAPHQETHSERLMRLEQRVGCLEMIAEQLIDRMANTIGEPIQGTGVKASA